MERVQYSLEASLPELKDLQANGIFSPMEIKEIIKRRTNYELQLIRRQPRKKDFLDYIEYEMALERLRHTPLPHSLSSHSLVQKQFSIFERATRKFKGDVRLWVQYIDVAKKEGAGNLVGRIVAKALKLHPSSIPLYILAAQHELDQSLPSAARNLLQRGIRINNTSIDLWCEYVKMELGWCEFLKRRWETLGIRPTEDSLEDTTSDADSARKDVLNGAIVKEVLSNALQALPALKTFDALLQTLQNYPTPLSKSLIPFLFELLPHYQGLKDASNGQIRARYATRHLSTLPEGKAFVEGLKLANEELVASCSRSPEEGESPEVVDSLTAYAEFVTKQWETITEGNLPLPRNQMQNPGRDAVFSAHLRILLDPTHPQPLPTARKICKLARQYSVASTNNLRDVSRLARSQCTGEGIESVWTWGWDQLTTLERETLIKETLLLPSNTKMAHLREILTLRTLSSIYHTITDASVQSNTLEVTAKGRRQTITRLLQTYVPSPEVYRHAFDLERNLPAAADPKSPKNGESSSHILETIYLLWRDHSLQSKEDATFAYAAHMLEIGSVGEATRMFNNLLSTATSLEAREGMEKRWKGVVDGKGPDTTGDSRMEIDADSPSNQNHSSAEESDDDVEFVVVG
ncbi:hypothetical protein M408DRAFT_8499 [Serendipita vermifera MAFF 305830]|uniref:U3 small nucleolar RNA-associated protein 6 N-terminal domain-containing protein n=1 Tax=Serendipita vermifera MAFF 305830 TaxID=933852 RepID=A0A0C2WSP9_SERVB|nr:hypothetical protein M408DRAFT_8499 [Serendipita vermifera MAFF 305830]